MRLGGCRTGVRRGLTWGAATDAAAQASEPHLIIIIIIIIFVFGFTPTHAKSGRFAKIRAESDRISQISVCFDTR